MAATEVLCPVALQGPSMEGLKTFFGYLMSAQRLNQDLQLKYILPTMFDKRTRHSFETLKQLNRLFRKQICDPIHYSVRLSEAPGRGKTILEYRPSGIVAGDYQKLVRRIINDESQKE
jgi:chromosome partitioning protein